MNQVRTVPETDIVIVSGCIEPALARDFQDEWIDTLSLEKRQALLMPRKFLDDDYSVDGVLARPKLPATHRVLGLLGFAFEDDGGFGINFQAPLGAQNFH